MTQPNRALVVDASIAVKWHLTDEEFTVESLAILQEFGAGRLSLLAPDQIRYEVASAIAVATIGRQPRLNRDEGQRAIEEFLSLGLILQSDGALIMDAYALVHRFGCALYDALYVALAEREGVDFITADARLYQRVRDLPFIIWIGDYQPENLSGAGT
jgi:predicted nucleic acid-binding protein